MPLDLGDLNEFYDGGMLATVNGKQYRIPPVSGELGLWGRRAAVLRLKLGPEPTLEELARIADEIGDPPSPEGLTEAQVMLSPALYAELLADGVDDEMIRHLAGTVYARIVGGDALALAFAHGELPNLLSPANREQRRATKVRAASRKVAPKVSGSGTTSTEKAATTRKAVSGSDTTTRKASAANAKAGKTAGSRGRKS